MSILVKRLANRGQSREFREPVGWLLGDQLLAGLKSIAVYLFYGDKLDARDWMEGSCEDLSHGELDDGAFWFDYIADTGDGQRATYSIAYLCHGDLYLPSDSSQSGPEMVSLTPGGYRLPRGRFLFVGGDTAYHIADLPSLAERFQTPFNWAFADRFGDDTEAADVRPIYAIPANHDYYDALDGFNRQFRRPLDPYYLPGDAFAPKPEPQLNLKGFEARQSASFVAIKLPFDWWLWGLDSQEGKVDIRQLAFFRQWFHQGRPPEKLIVATPEPSTVFGRWATREGEKGALIKTFERLDLPPCFLQEQDGELPNTQCRLDLSGDIHHYARHWGPGSAPGNFSRKNYASVVAGGGGAFLHPSDTDVGQVRQNALYPAREESRRLMIGSLLDPGRIWSGGYVWLAGALAALVSYFMVTIPQSTWSIFQLIGNDLRPCGAASRCGDTLLQRVQAALSLGPDVNFSVFNRFAGDLSYAVALGAFLVVWSFRLKVLRKQPGAVQEVWQRGVLGFLAPCILAGLPIMLLASVSGETLPPPLMASAIILAFAVSSSISLVIGRRFADLLVVRAKLGQRITALDKLIAPLFIAFSLLCFCFSLWRYGGYTVAVMFADIVAILVLLLVTLGLVLLAGVYGASLQIGRAGRFCFWGIGLWHAVMQLAVPVVLALYGSWRDVALVTAILLSSTYAMAWLGPKIGSSGRAPLDPAKWAGLLSLIWLALGVFALSAAWWGDAAPVGWGRLILAFSIGAVYSCIWFGWYLAISLSMNGHNNEAGGAARSERYRHLLRFKLTSEELTAYVIGIDDPREHLDDQGRFRADTRLRLVDVFTLKRGR